jgi:hypothetical protein
MDEFGYLAVILSIILGLSVTQLLQGLSNVINARDRVRIYWPAIGWALLLLVIDVQAWRALFGFTPSTCLDLSSVCGSFA